ncbi:MAG: hypothetical protein M5U34_04860 [Chloroflexi bacterium]|nr:hypothetical protein [Chloroflexota bacterium]
MTIANIQDGAAEVLNATVGATGITAVYANGELQLTGPSSTANFNKCCVPSPTTTGFPGPDHHHPHHRIRRDRRWKPQRQQRQRQQRRHHHRRQ